MEFILLRYDWTKLLCGWVKEIFGTLQIENTDDEHAGDYKNIEVCGLWASDMKLMIVCRNFSSQRRNILRDIKSSYDNSFFPFFLFFFFWKSMNISQRRSIKREELWSVGNKVVGKILGWLSRDRKVHCNFLYGWKVLSG